jgi:hypothetical protein
LRRWRFGAQRLLNCERMPLERSDLFPHQGTKLFEL